MSASIVRSAFRAKIAGLLAAQNFEFVESVNLAESTKELPSRWYTLDFAVSGDHRLSLGVPALFREQGSVSVVIFTEQNVHDTDAVAAADVIRAAMCNWSAEGGHLRIQQAGPPTDLDGGDFRGSFYGILVDIGYTFDRIQ
jgi:hypothetical protein